MALIWFRSIAAFENAAGATPEVFADIPKFTNVQPIIQFSEDLS
jgi:hypothetical protein